jgi:hypothetical protein
LIDLHCGTPPFNEAGSVERDALRKMMEAVKRENERAEMLLIALALYPAQSPEKREAAREFEYLTFQPVPDAFATPGLTTG